MAIYEDTLSPDHPDQARQSLAAVVAALEDRA
jgi:hypothetical protein